MNILEKEHITKFNVEYEKELQFKYSLFGFLLLDSSSSSSSESKKRSSCGFDGGFLNLWMYPSISWLFNLFSGLNFQEEKQNQILHDYLGYEYLLTAIMRLIMGMSLM